LFLIGRLERDAAAFDLLESGDRDAQRVSAGNQEWDVPVALEVGFGGAVDTGVVGVNHDLGIDDDGTLRIDDATAHGSASFLAEGELRG
jgi:hypothetical protein